MNEADKSCGDGGRKQNGVGVIFLAVVSKTFPRLIRSKKGILGSATFQLQDACSFHFSDFGVKIALSHPMLKNFFG